MIFLKIIRVLITIVLVIALLVSGGIALFTYSLSRVILDEDYYGEYLLESDFYADVFEFIMEDYANLDEMKSSPEQTDDIFFDHFQNEAMPEFLSEVVADYLSDWMEYIMGKQDKESLPSMKIENNLDDVYDYALELAEDEEFLMAMLEDSLEFTGDSIDNYDKSEYADLIKTLHIKEDYIDVVNETKNNEEIFNSLLEFEGDPLAFFRSSSDLSDEELTEQLQNNHGILKRYNDIANLVYYAIIAAVLILFLMWLNKMQVALIINGIVLVLSSIPILLLSASERLFNGILHLAAEFILEDMKMFDMSEFNFYTYSAIRPIIDSMKTVSVIIFALGIIFFVIGAIISNKKQKEQYKNLSQNQEL